MKCTLDGSNARIMGKAIQSLSKFGSDLFIEADKTGMQLRSLNSSRSALGTFIFKRSFFETYSIKSDDENYCKVSMKAIVNIFKSMKNVEHCEFRIIEELLKFHITLSCKREEVRTHNISIVDEENIAPAVSPEQASNTISGSHKIFTEISNNFNSTEEEITFEVYKKGLYTKNYIEGAQVTEKFMRSQLKLTPNEFDKYAIENETIITFCLKEFRAFLMFAESINENIVLNFEEAGSPVFLRIKRYDQVECLLIMSTLSPEDISIHEECRESEVTELHDRSTRNQSAQKRKQKATPANNNKPKRHISEETTLTNDTSLFQFPGENGTTNGNLTARSAEVPRNANESAQNEFNEDNHEDILMAAMSTIEDVENISLNDDKDSQSDALSVTFYNTEDCQPQKTPKLKKVATSDIIPQSPSNKNDGQIRKIFSRCFLSTYVPQEPSPNSQVYVPDSDTEDA